MNTLVSPLEQDAIAVLNEEPWVDVSWPLPTTGLNASYPTQLELRACFGIASNQTSAYPPHTYKVISTQTGI